MTKLPRLSRSGLAAVVTEIALIFLGIMAAFQMDSWNERRHEERKASAILAEIADGLMLDTADLGHNLRSNAGIRASIDTVLAWLGAVQPFDSSTSHQFAGAIGLNLFISNSAGYENLKSVGVDLVTADALRAEITRYYENTYQLVGQGEDVFLKPHWNLEVKPRMMRHFESAFPGSIGEPRNVAALRADDGLSAALASYRAMLEFTDAVSARALERSVTVLDLVRQYLDAR